MLGGALARRAPSIPATAGRTSAICSVFSRPVKKRNRKQMQECRKTSCMSDLRSHSPRDLRAAGVPLSKLCQHHEHCPIHPTVAKPKIHPAQAESHKLAWAAEQKSMKELELNFCSMRQCPSVPPLPLPAQ